MAKELKKTKLKLRSILDLMETNCIICHQNNDQMILLPCKQCNHEHIENRKYVHIECLEKTLIIDNRISTVCPYCNYGSLGVKYTDKIDWNVTIGWWVNRNISVGFGVALIWLAIILGVSDVKPPEDLVIISSTTYKALHMLLYVMLTCSTMLGFTLITNLYEEITTWHIFKNYKIVIS